MSYRSLTITHINEEVPGVKTFTFGGPEAEGIAYQPGQYLTLVRQQGGQEIRRSYSISSALALHEPLTIAVKRIANGVFSRWLIDAARVGDTVQTTGASGFFTLPQGPQTFRQVFFWAAGSGITPVFSLIKTLLHGHPAVWVVLVYSNSSPSVAIFREELRQLEERFPASFKIIFLYSNARRLDQARLHKNLLKEIFRRNSSSSVVQTLCYVCGPENYRRLCLYGLRELQVPKENLWQENFNVLKMAAKATPPDTEPHVVLLHANGQTHRLQVQFPTTILQAARQAGVAVPFSCETGVCGNCAAQCLEGSVWMSYNEVLTDREVNKGLTLTCVGYPVGGDVQLTFLP